MMFLFFWLCCVFRLCRVFDIPSFTKGIYTVEAYTEQGLLGRSELMLR